MSSIINGSGSVNYYVTPTGVSIVGSIKSYDTYAKMYAETNPPEYAIVVDASEDPTVKSGSAVYVYKNNTWVKVYETESMDLDDQFNWDNIVGKPDISKEEYDEFVKQIEQLQTLDLTGSILKYNEEPVFEASTHVKVSGSGLTATYNSDNTVTIQSDRTVQGLGTISSTTYNSSLEFMEAVAAAGYPINSVVMGTIRTLDLPDEITKANITIGITEEQDEIKYNACIHAEDLDGLYVTHYTTADTVVEWASATGSSATGGLAWEVL